MAIKGLAQVRRNLLKELTTETNKRAAAAVKVGTSIIAGYAGLMTPIGKTSVLINSQFQAIIPHDGGVIGRVGYSNEAPYALFVHEAEGKLKGEMRPDGSGEFWSPSGEPQFLRKAGDDNVDEIRKAIEEAMSV